MTDTIEQKALALVNEVRAEWDLHPYDEFNREAICLHEALCRAIEQHEAFRQEVSDAIEANWRGSNFGPPEYLARFIIPKPVDPLVEVMAEVSHVNDAKAAEELRQALAKRGYEIREKAGD